MNPIRRKVLEANYTVIQPYIEYIGSQVPQGLTFLDVGSSEGLIALRTAKDLHAGKTILVDKLERPEVDLPKNAEFHLLDVCSEEFPSRFQHKVHIITCVSTFHEFEDPVRGVWQMLSTLPVRGILLLFETSELGWKLQDRMHPNPQSPERKHYEQDMVRIRKYGLHTDAGIRHFWEERCFPNIPGACKLIFEGGIYIVQYQAAPWGMVKEPPAHIRQEIAAWEKSQKT